MAVDIFDRVLRSGFHRREVMAEDQAEVARSQMQKIVVAALIAKGAQTTDLKELKFESPSGLDIHQIRTYNNQRVLDQVRKTLA
jgi:uncharacterized membrane protein